MEASRRRALLAATVLVAAAVAVATPPAAAQGGAPELDARAWVLVDAEDGEVLASRAARRSYPVASTTKLMTAYVARRSLRLGRRVVAPAYVANTAESLLGLVEGERITVRDLLYGLILASGNDAAVALAEASAGSVGAFVSKMNRAARGLELDDTSYANPIGLDEPGNFSSAADLVALVRALTEQRLFRRMFDSPDAVLRSGARVRRIANRNTLVRTVPWVSGVKTGYTLGAGYVLVGSASRKGVELVSAVLGAPAEASRDAETLELFDYGFSLYRRREPVAAGERLASAALRYQDDSLPLRAAHPVELTVREDQRLDVDVAAPAEVDGPIDRGERLGQVAVSVDGEVVERVPLTAARSAPAATLADRVDAAIPGPRLAAWAAVTIVVAAFLILVVRLLGRSSSLRRGDSE